MILMKLSYYVNLFFSGVEQGCFIWGSVLSFPLKENKSTIDQTIIFSVVIFPHTTCGHLKYL